MVAGPVTKQLALTAAASTLAVAVAVVAMFVRPPPRQQAWWWLILGAAGLAFGRVSFAVLREALPLVDHMDILEIQSLVFYPAVGVGLLMLGGRTRDSDLADTLDATIVALGAFLLLWLFLLNGRLAPRGTDVVIAIVRPVGVAILVGALTRLLFVVGRRTVAFWLLVAAIIFGISGAVGDVGQSVGYPFPRLLTDTGFWFVGYSVLLAAALLHPSITASLTTRHRAVSRLSPTRLSVFVALTLLGPFAWLRGRSPDCLQPSLRERFRSPSLRGCPGDIVAVVAYVAHHPAGRPPCR